MLSILQLCSAVVSLKYVFRLEEKPIMQVVRTPSTLDINVSDSNRVLRNTYMLLALSMIPTIFGAWLGVTMQFSLLASRPFIGFLVYMAVAFGFLFAIERTKDSALGVVFLLGFTGFMGLMLSNILQVALSFSNGTQMIMTAAGGTAVIFASLATLATVTKKDFSFMGKFLFIGLILMIVASVANIWLAMPLLQLTISAIGVMIFSAYILYDVSRVVTGGETNYIKATLAIFLDIFNLFVNLLSLLMMLTGERD